MNGLAKQRGSRFFVVERHHDHSDVTAGTFYEEKKPTIWLQYLFDLNKTQRCKAFRGFFVSIFLFFLLFFFILKDNLVMEVSSAASSHMTAQSNKQWIKSNTDVTHFMEHVLFATIIQCTNCMDVLLSFLVNLLHHMFGVNLETVLVNC